jgi:hypothetical protein
MPMWAMAGSSVYRRVRVSAGWPACHSVDALESDLAFEAEGDMGQQVAEELALGERGRQDAGQFARGDFLAAGQSRGDVVSPVAVSLFGEGEQDFFA